MTPQLTAPDRVSVELEIDSLFKIIKAPCERGFVSRLIRPYPDRFLDYDLHGAELGIEIVITFPDGRIGILRDMLKGKCGDVDRKSSYKKRYEILALAASRREKE